jgi:hypothetical protein
VVSRADTDPEVEMSFDPKVLSYFQELEALKGLEEKESKAFLDLLVLAILADEEITDEELEQLDEELLRLPFLWDAEMQERVVEHSAKTREYVESILGDEAQLNIFIKGLAAGISSGEHRTIALRMFTAVILADGITDMERERIFDVGSAFGFESDNVRDVIDDVLDSLGE